MYLNFHSKLQLLPFLAGLMLITTSCGPTSHFISANEAIYDSTGVSTKRQANGCNSWKHYTEAKFTDQVPTRKVRVNIHFLNVEDSSLNFTEKEGVQYAKNLVYNSNENWANNRKMNLPLGNETPVLPTRVRIVLSPDTSLPEDDGIYFHYNDTLGKYNSAEQGKTLFSREHFRRYGRQKGRVVNIFLMESHPDSLASATYNTRNHGIGLSNWLKVIGGYKNSKEYILDDKGDSVSLGAWNLARLLNHELGHGFGLAHTWRGNDGCEDTPNNPNCWNYADSGPCDSLLTNNLMDYSHVQLAVTPCQIGQMHRNFSRPGSPQRKKLVREFCDLDTTKNVFLQSADTIHIRGYHDFYGNVTIAGNTVVVIHCDITMPAGSVIALQPGSQLILDNATISNACGKQWMGVRTAVRRAGKGRLILRGSAEVDNAATWKPAN